MIVPMPEAQKITILPLIFRGKNWKSLTVSNQRSSALCPTLPAANFLILLLLQRRLIFVHSRSHQQIATPTL
jgi:hypothetical protein